MNYNWLENYCLAKKKAVKEFKAEWDAHRFLIGDKMFAMIGDDNKGKDIITLKLLPDNGNILREKYKDITPGYYMNKVHWNSVDLNGKVPDDILKKMVDESYELVFNSLTKKMQKEIID